VSSVIWPSPADSENPHVVLVVENPDDQDTKEAESLLQEAGINYVVENNGSRKDPADGPLPWVMTATNGAYAGVAQIGWYVRTFGGSCLQY
jgi:hypothetical protein